jgi:hypothetical protein
MDALLPTLAREVSVRFAVAMFLVSVDWWGAFRAKRSTLGIEAFWLVVRVLILLVEASRAPIEIGTESRLMFGMVWVVVASRNKSEE